MRALLVSALLCLSACAPSPEPVIDQDEARIKAVLDPLIGMYYTKVLENLSSEFSSCYDTDIDRYCLEGIKYKKDVVVYISNLGIIESYTITRTYPGITR